jgi:hypothetical protein
MIDASMFSSWPGLVSLATRSYMVDVGVKHVACSGFCKHRCCMIL